MREIAQQKVWSLPYRFVLEASLPALSDIWSLEDFTNEEKESRREIYWSFQEIEGLTVWTRGKAKGQRNRPSCNQGEGKECVGSKQEDGGRV